MIVIVAVDDRNGMMFNRRRQSQDRVLREHILDMTVGKKLWMNHYTEKQFADSDNFAQINVSDDFLNEAAPGEYCFVENEPLSPYSRWIEQLVIFRWNRAYPGDFYFDLPLDEWKLISTEEFPGPSHEKITKEVYER